MSTNKFIINSELKDDKEMKTKTDIKHPYLKKGEGKLASHFHGETKFAQQRKMKIIREQEEREQKGEN
jgi:hypothetical protein